MFVIKARKEKERRFHFIGAGGRKLSSPDLAQRFDSEGEANKIVNALRQVNPKLEVKIERVRT